MISLPALPTSLTPHLPRPSLSFSSLSLSLLSSSPSSLIYLPHLIDTLDFFHPSPTFTQRLSSSTQSSCYSFSCIPSCLPPCRDFEAEREVQVNLLDHWYAKRLLQYILVVQCRRGGVELPAGSNESALACCIGCLGGRRRARQSEQWQSPPSDKAGYRLTSLTVGSREQS